MKKGLVFIFITMVIDITGWGIIIPVLPNLIKNMLQVDISEASKYGGWLLFAYAFSQFLCSPLMGNLSDRFGRRPIILASLLAFAFDYLILAFAPTLTWLFIGRVIAGITGASISTATAYISDISTAEDKSKNFGLIGAAFGIGFVLGPIIGGLLGQFGVRVPFYAAAILCFANFIYGYFYLPESLQKENRRTFDIKKINPLTAIYQLKKYPKILGLFLALTLVYIGSHAVHSNWSYYTMYAFQWNETMIGISLGVIGILVGIVQGVLIRFINPKLGDKKSILVGLLLYTLGMFLFAFASKSWMMFVFLIPYCLGGIAGPAMQSMITSNVPANEQGAIQGTLSSLMSATSIIGPPMMTSVFYFFTHKNSWFIFGGAPFVLGGCLMLLSLWVAWFGFRKT